MSLISGKPGCCFSKGVRLLSKGRISESDNPTLVSDAMSLISGKPGCCFSKGVRLLSKGRISNRTL